jgi:ankyrin repeat protein
LLDSGANIDAEDPNDGRTALMIACEKGYVEIVDHLIEREANILTRDKK